MSKPRLTRREALTAIAAGFAPSVLFPGSTRAHGQSPTSVTPKQILAHYMPWFEAKPKSGHWGWHWTMNAFDPDKLDGGIRQIASHFHPLIGPYDSGDRDVLEYHVLLMRLAGIDGVVVDWYGLANYLDYGSNHAHTVALVDVAARLHLKVAICYEDQTVTKLVAAGRVAPGDRVEHARSELRWLAEHWFRSPAYLRVDGRPLLLSFGQEGLNDLEWSRALDGLPDKPLYLSEHNPRTTASGAFDWPIPRAGLKAQEEFEVRSKSWKTAMPVAFPRFDDIYEKAKVQQGYGKIDDQQGKLFEKTLAAALRSRTPLVQICTWNDWGEGTMIEPSVEFGYRDLETVQRLRKAHAEKAFAVSRGDLSLPLRLYHLRKQKAVDAALTRRLDEAAALLADRSMAAGRRLLDQIEASTKD